MRVSVSSKADLSCKVVSQLIRIGRVLDPNQEDVKSEARSSKFETSSKSEGSKSANWHASVRVIRLGPSNFRFRICFESRISSFEFEDYSRRSAQTLVR